MYQSVYFNRNTGEDQYHYYVRDDKKNISHFQYWPTVYKLDEEGEFKTLFGDRCTPIKGKYDKKDPNILEKDIERELVFLRDFYYKSDEMPSYHNILYLDIEIEILGPLTPYTIKDAKAEITAIALNDVTCKEKTCFILDKNSELQEITEDGVTIIPCKTENILLNKFLSKWEEIDPTIVVGYNSDFFDIPYLYYRIQKLLGDEVLRLSPIRKIDENPYNPYSPIKIGLVNCLDFMLLFKKYIAKEEPSYKLGDVGTKYVQLGKIEYDGGLDKLFKENKTLYVKYNIRDIDILESLENKLKFIELTVLISHLCHTPYESIYYNTTLNEGAILTYLKRENIVAPNKPTTTNPSIRELEIGDIVIHQRGTSTIEGTIYQIDEKQAVIKNKAGNYLNRSIKTIRKKDGYAGGFLLDIKPGLYKWLIDADYSSLYPSIIRSLNIGIETLKGRIVFPNSNYDCWCSMVELEEKNPEDIIDIEKLDHKTYKLKRIQIKVGDLIEVIKENNWSISANGVIYDTQKTSVAAKVLSGWFLLRQEYKNKMKKAYKEGDNESGDLYHLYQYSFKILLNALYGTYAINSWRFTDGFKICSSSITTSGQRSIQETIRYANEYISKTLIKD